MRVTAIFTLLSECVMYLIMGLFSMIVVIVGAITLAMITAGVFIFLYAYAFVPTMKWLGL